MKVVLVPIGHKTIERKQKKEQYQQRLTNRNAQREQIDAERLQKARDFLNDKQDPLKATHATDPNTDDFKRMCRQLSQNITEGETEYVPLDSREHETMKEEQEPTVTVYSETDRNMEAVFGEPRETE